jgi:hypothetical protein
MFFTSIFSLYPRVSWLPTLANKGERASTIDEIPLDGSGLFAVGVDDRRSLLDRRDEKRDLWTLRKSAREHDFAAHCR